MGPGRGGGRRGAGGAGAGAVAAAAAAAVLILAGPAAGAAPGGVAGGWRREGLGAAAAAAALPGSGGWVVASAQGTVGRLDGATGELVWRRSVGNAGRSPELAAVGSEVWLLGDGGSSLQAFSTADGTLEWQLHRSQAGGAGGSLLPAQGGGEGALYAWGSGVAAVGSRGKIAWEMQWKESLSGVQFCTKPGEGSQVHVAGVAAASGALTVLSLDMSNGGILGMRVSTRGRADASTLRCSGTSAVASVEGKGVIALSTDGSEYVIAKVGDGLTSSHRGSGAVALTDSSGGLSTLLRGVFPKDWTIASGRMPLEGKGWVLGEAAVPESSTITVLRAEGAGLGFLHVSRTGVRTDLPASTGWLAKEHGATRRAFVSGEGSGIQVLLFSADGSLSLHRPGKETLWVREEALSEITRVHFFDLPEARSGDHLADDDENAASLQELVHMEVVSAKVLLRLASQAEVEEFAKYRSRSSTHMRKTLDPQGFRKILIVLTAAGKVFALHNGDGHIVWSYFPGVGAKDLVLASEDPSRRSAPTVALVRQQGTAKSTVTWLNVHTGQAVDEEIALAADHVFSAPNPEKAGERVLFVVDAERSLARALTATDAPADQLQAAARSAYLYTVKHAEGALRGFSLGMPSADGAPATFAVDEIWATQLASSGGSVVATAVPAAGDPTFSQARVLGDQSVMYKYVSPNLLFTASGGEPADTDSEPALSVALIDTVTGRVLYRVRHDDSAGPVHAVVCENWIVYQYWSSRAGRSQISVLELFDDYATKRDQSAMKAAKQYLAGDFANRTATSFSIPPLKVLGQTYFPPFEASTMSATRSQAGITQRWVLVGTPPGEVYAIERRFLDPRRPKGKPTKQDQAERLVVYNEQLPLVPHMLLTRGEPVVGLTGIATAPSRQESSSHMFAYGVDLFYTHLAPSKSFDRLTEDFSQGLLVATMLALGVGAVFLQRAVRRDDLKRAWA